MADTLTTITTFINSPPGQLAAGGVLGAIVWKFFKNVGDALNEAATREIAVWLLNRPTVSSSPFNMPQSVLDWIGKVFGGFLPSEESLTKTWKVLGLCTCM